MKYSILIPSRNGGKYLYFAVKSVLSNRYDNFELIVSLNKSNDNSEKKLLKIKDKRLKIIRTPKYFSMVKHYEWVLKKAKGEWISILGDDDGVVKNFFLKIDKILNNNDQNIEAISSKLANYYWKGVDHIYGHTVVRYLDTGKVTIKNSKTELIKTLMGFSNYQNLPQLYTSGIIKKKLIDKIINKSKRRFFNEPNPDVYSALTISSSTKKFLRVEKPLFWAGTSKKSNAVKLMNDFNIGKNKIKHNFFLNHAMKDGFKLSKKIDPCFWHYRLKSGFLFSAFYNIPKKINKLSKNSIIQFIFFLRLLCDIKDKKLELNIKEKIFIKERVIAYITKKSNRYYFILFISKIYFLILKLFFSTQYLNFKLQNFIYKIFLKKNFIYSKNRKKYKNILVANKEI